MVLIYKDYKLENIILQNQIFRVYFEDKPKLGYLFAFISYENNQSVLFIANSR